MSTVSQIAYTDSFVPRPQLNPPVVSFIVPCYNLGHLLGDCLQSILCQTYTHFEILIMDDCSPDNTPDVARSFSDPRVIHIRNDKNLGHLRNYNKGIELSKGRYIWLISADDSLRKPYVLSRYVDVLERNPEVGYVTCPAVCLEDGQEAGVMAHTLAPGTKDRIFTSREFLELLLQSNIVPAPATMARKQCYEQVSMFPLDLPYGGDWYLWSVFALQFDVAYLSEPMVYRRMHDKNVSRYFWSEGQTGLIHDEIEVPWRVKRHAEKQGRVDVTSLCDRLIASTYSRTILRHSEEKRQIGITIEQFKHSVADHANSSDEQKRISSFVYATLADGYFDRADFPQAENFYRSCLNLDPSSLAVWVKLGLTRLGTLGKQLKDFLGRTHRLLHHYRALTKQSFGRNL